MNIGEKIKKLRNEKFMTQSQLAGIEITRNMLSRIENGAALPSLGTVKYLAARLNVPAGYLIGGPEDERIYKKNTELKEIKKAYKSKNYAICLDMCKKSGLEDEDEIMLIMAESAFAAAEEEFGEGKLREACRLFDEAAEYVGRTAYYAEQIKSGAAVYFRYMQRISATLSSNMFDEAQVFCAPAFGNEFCLYASALAEIENNENYLASTFIEKYGKNNVYSLHLSALGDMRGRLFVSAHAKLIRMLKADVKIPEPVLYFVFSDIEVCSKEIGDYKGAYEYSHNKASIIQKLLS